jgi:hypothetical protein
MFNTFVDIYMKIFYTCFPEKKIVSSPPPDNDWQSELKRFVKGKENCAFQQRFMVII